MADDIPEWRVTSLTPFTDFVPGRGPIEGQQVNFVTNSGLSGSVFVPNVELSNEDKVRAQVIERINYLHTLHTMSG